MKWIRLVVSIVFMAGCCCTNVVAYRPVLVIPVVSQVIEHVRVYAYPQGPLDVTTTTIDFY
ncbi:MAG: hypothetical protein ACRCXC_04070 [Legionella sp.]